MHFAGEKPYVYRPGGSSKGQHPQQAAGWGGWDAPATKAALDAPGLGH